MLTMKVCRSKYYLSLFQNRALAPLQIPASLYEGPIYLLLCWVITLLFKSTSWSALVSFASITINLYWVWLWLDLFYHELQRLVSPWSLKVLCIYVLQSQKGLTRYHFVISCYKYFENVLSSEFYYYVLLADYAIDMSKLETYALLWMWLVIIFAEYLNDGFTYLQQQEQIEFVKVFFITFSLSTELLEDKQRFKLGGVDRSPTYLLFQTLLPLFWTLTCMIWMKLTQTNAVFSRTAMVLFIVQKTKVLGITWKSTEITFEKYKKYWRNNQGQGAHTLSTRVGAGLPPGHAPCLMGPLVLHRPQLQLYIFTFGDRKIKEKDSSHFTIRNRHQALISLGRADLESVRGSGEGNPSPSSSSTILHHQFHDAHRRAWVIPS